MPLRLAISALALALCAVLASCSGDTQASLKTEYVTKISEMKSVLDRVNDRASAERERPALERIVAAMNDLTRRAQALGDPLPEISEEIQKETRALQSSFMKLAFDQEIMKVLEPVFTNLGGGLGPKKKGGGSAVGMNPDGTPAHGTPPLGSDPAALQKLVDELQKKAAVDGSGATPPAMSDLPDLADPAKQAAGAADAALQQLVATLANAEATAEQKQAALMQLNMRSATQQAEIVVPALMQALDEQHFGVRTQAATLLVRYGERAAPAADKLAGFLEDPQFGPVAASVLASLGTHAKSALPVITDKLNSATSPAVVASILSVLEALGPAARSALPALDNVMKKFPYLAPRANEVKQSIERSQ